MSLPDAKYPLAIQAAFYLLMSPLHILKGDELLKGFVNRSIGDDAILKHVVGVQGVSMLFIGLVLLDGAYCGSAAGQKVVSRIALIAQLVGVAHEFNTGINAGQSPVYITFAILLSCSIIGMISASQAQVKTPTKKKK